MAYTLEEQAAAAAAAKPVLWSRLSVRHPIKTCVVSLLVPIIALGIIVVSRSFAIDNPASDDYLIRNDIRTQLDDARQAAFDEFPFTDVDDSSDGQVPERTVEDGSLALSILFRGRVGAGGDVGVLGVTSDNASNVLTKDGLNLMKKVEDAILNREGYSDFCLRDPEVTDCDGRELPCVFPRSILNSPFLYGQFTTDADGEERLCGREAGTREISDNDFERFIDSLVVQDSDGNAVPNPTFSGFLGIDFSDETKSTWITQSTFRFGQPFANFSSLDDRVEDQAKAIEDWTFAAADDIQSFTTPTIDVFLIGAALIDASFGAVVTRDLTFSVVAIILVFLVIWFHTTSAFLASTAMAQIFLAFPLAYVVYRFIFRQDYFGALQILVIFLLLGIGADDVFVFTDAWKQSNVVLGKGCDLETRMSWTYRRAVRAMSVTSATTAAAFFVTATSPIMPISTLGVWAGALILLQFFLVITIYPCAVIIWHKFFRVRSIVNCFKRPSEEQLDIPKIPLYQRCLPPSWRPERDPDRAAEYRPIERFFRGPWLGIIARVRYVLIALAVALVAVSIWLATRLEAPTENEEFLPESNELRVALMIRREAFPTSDAALQLRVRITWGIKGVDRTGTSRFNPSNPGKAIFDETFDLTRAAAQQHIWEACEFFQRQDDLLFQGETLDNVDCWIDDFRSWRASQGREEFEDYPNDAAMTEEILRFGNHEDLSGRRPFRRYLTEQHIGFRNDSQIQIMFTEIRFVSSTKAAEPYRIMWPVYQEWQEQLRILNNQAPAEARESINKAIATGGYSWMWQISQIRLVRSMFIGIGTMLGVALVTLVFSTLNWLVSILTTITIGGIVAMLTGVVYLLGWDLGITESIGIVIAIGYSFDGAAHIATAYVESLNFSRFDRVRDALTDLGISVLFGAISTLLAGFMLFPAIIIFFQKFAGLIVITVSLGLIWSLIFLPALLLVLGPTGETGDLKPYVKKIFSCFRKRRASTVVTDYDDQPKHSDVPSSKTADDALTE
eukprot:GFKZ01008474.1.p1 GENE.GFKZ01008474.1~~GFKZ01008474.1.p1  ORF type:complete len:1014 (+),score=125.22 GFKZ01008474.1:449-3490(+)